MEGVRISIGFKPAVRGPEALVDSAGQIETKCLSDLGSEDTKGGSRIDARRDRDLVGTGAKHHGDHDAFIVTRIVMDPRKVQLIHALPAGEWYVLVPGNAGEERFDGSRRFGRRAYGRQLFSVRNQAGPI